MDCLGIGNRAGPLLHWVEVEAKPLVRWGASGPAGARNGRAHCSVAGWLISSECCVTIHKITRAEHTTHAAWSASACMQGSETARATLLALRSRARKHLGTTGPPRVVLLFISSVIPCG
jgi:hypothetical protein